jgi:hypothetical protein
LQNMLAELGQFSHVEQCYRFWTLFQG